jgi:hypothetical protein
MKEFDRFTESVPGKAIAAWNRFWFTPTDPTTLGFIRICCGFLVFYIHLAYCYDLEGFFGRHAWTDLALMNRLRHEAPVLSVPLGWEEPKLQRPEPGSPEEAYFKEWGVLPNQTIAKGQYAFSLWYHIADPTEMAITHGIILLIMFLFAIGFCTRLTSVLTWLGMLCYTQRAQTALFGMDAMVNITAFYLMLGPSGAALSMDRLIKHYWAKTRALRLGLPVPVAEKPAPLVSANVALRLLQLNLCLIYFMSGCSKLQGTLWWNGYAVWGTMANYEFSPMTHALYMDALRFLSRHRWLFETVITLGSYGTLAFEVGFPFLIWNRHLRSATIITGVMMHLGIAFFMGLVAFSLIMITMAASFIPPAAIRGLFDRIGAVLNPRLTGVS